MTLKLIITRDRPFGIVEVFPIIHLIDYSLLIELNSDELSVEENYEIKKFAKGKEGIHQDSVVDVFIKDKDKNLFIFDISSPKSNMKEAKSLKLKIMK